MKVKNRELKLVFLAVISIFAVFLGTPILMLFWKSIWKDGFTLEFYISVMTQKNFFVSLMNSFKIAIVSAMIATFLAFVIAYTVHYTNVPKWFKSFISFVTTLPMFLPTITYGFAIIYSFGKQGFLTRLFGRQFLIFMDLQGYLLDM